MKKPLLIILVVSVLFLAIFLDRVPEGVQAAYAGPEETYPAYCSIPRMLGVKGGAGLRLELFAKENQRQEVSLHVYVYSKLGGKPIGARPTVAAITDMTTGAQKREAIKINWDFSEAGKQEAIGFALPIGRRSSGGVRVALPSFGQGSGIWTPEPIYVVYAPAFFRLRSFFCN